MNSDDFDSDGNNIVPCPICWNVYCLSKQGGKCPEEDAFAKAHQDPYEGKKEQTTLEKIGVYFTIYGVLAFIWGTFTGVDFIQIGLLAMILGEVLKTK